MTQRGIQTTTVSESLVSSLAPGAIIGRSPRGNTIVQPIKIAVLGYHKTGKSAISLAFVNRVWVPHYDASQEDVFIKEIDLDNQVDVIDVLDSSASDDDYLDMCAVSWFGRDAFLIVYAVDSQLSFDYAVSIWESLAAHYKEKNKPVPPAVFFANKTDIPATNRVVDLNTSKMRSVEKTKAAHFDGSAKELSHGIEEAFNFLVRKVRETRRAQPSYNNLFRAAPAHEVHLKPNMSGSVISTRQPQEEKTAASISIAVPNENTPTASSGRKKSAAAENKLEKPNDKSPRSTGK